MEKFEYIYKSRENEIMKQSFLLHVPVTQIQCQFPASFIYIFIHFHILNACVPPNFFFPKIGTWLISYNLLVYLIYFGHFS